MKKLIAYIVGISIIAGGYYLCKQSFKSTDKSNNLIIKEIKVTPAEPVTTYIPTYIIHNIDGTIDFKIDTNYLRELNPLNTPETVIVTHHEDGSITFKK